MTYRFPPKTHERSAKFYPIDLADPIFEDEAILVNEGLKTNFKPDGKCPTTFTPKEIKKMIRTLEYVLPENDEHFGYEELKQVIRLLNK